MPRILVRLAVLSWVALALPADAHAQIIPVRTIPLATGDQFLFLPSVSRAMGGVSFALDDSLADPWSNPAKGVFVGGPALLSSPTFFAVTEDGGSGRTVPVAVLLAGGGWSGGAALAMQQLHGSRDRTTWMEPLAMWSQWRPELLSDANARNLYAQVFGTRRLAGGPWSIGVGASVSGLDALGGVDMLYPNAARIVQSGGTDDVRVGLYRRGARERLSLVVARSRISMTHDVTYLEMRWPPPLPSGEVGGPTLETRVEDNLDETRTWAFQAAWDRDLNAPGWRAGVSATVNRKSHPGIPDYELQNIPRDPGTTWAYELGAGLSRTRGATTFGMDAAFQPIWSDTWQVADSAVIGASGGVIAVGGRTIENDFSFQNVLLRLGFDHDVGRGSIQLGLQVRSYDYDMDQKNHVTGTFRGQGEHWMEWTPTAGATLRVSGLEVRWFGSATTGSGRPGVSSWATPTFDDAPTLSSGDFLVAPQGPLTLQNATVWTQQLSVRIPIR
jgi:hypothetical protein